MKKFLTFLLLAFFTATGIQAQSVFTKAAANYRKHTEATASVSRTRHLAKMKKQKAAVTGSLYMQKSDKVAIIVNGGKDKLIMNGTQFTMVQGGKKHKTSSQTNPQFATFYKVFVALMAGSDVSKLEGVSVSNQGGTVEVKIVPVTTGKKPRLMFSSFELRIDAKTGALQSLRMNERNRSYTEYTFSNFKFGGSFSSKVFVP